jgi:hypothetical protein
MSEWIPKFKVGDTIRLLRMNNIIEKGELKDPNKKKETFWEEQTIDELDVSGKSYRFKSGYSMWGPDVDKQSYLVDKQGGRRKRTRNIKTGGKWSAKYKKSINCKRPKGFSQRQHCKYGRKKTRKNRN